MSNHRQIDTSGERRAAGLLEKIQLGDRPDMVFKALRSCVPVAGGLIGVMNSELTGSMVNHVVDLPGEVLDAWATTPEPHKRRMMSPLIEAAPGELISDRSKITGSFRHQLELLQVMESAGLGEAAGYKLATRTSRRGTPELRFMTLALEGRAMFTDAVRELFRRLHPLIEAALEKIAVPLVPDIPVLGQMFEARRVGFMCVSSNRSLIEYNERAWELARQYAEVARVEPGRGWHVSFVEQVLSRTAENREWRLFRPDRRARLVICTYPLDPEVCAYDRDVTLVEMRETEFSLPPAELSPRRRQVAELLVFEVLAEQQIAARLGIGKESVRKHRQAVYRVFGVKNRQELRSTLR